MLAYICLMKFKIRPSDYMKMDRKEKAFIQAAVRFEDDQRKRAELAAEQAARRMQR